MERALHRHPSENTQILTHALPCLYIDNDELVKFWWYAGNYNLRRDTYSMYSIYCFISTYWQQCDSERIIHKYTVYFMRNTRKVNTGDTINDNFRQAMVSRN